MELPGEALAAGLVLALSVAPAVAGSEDRPALTLDHRRSGGTRAGETSVAIAADGTVLVRESRPRTKDLDRTVTLPVSGHQQLARLVREARFFEEDWPAAMQALHAGTTVVRITLDGRSKERTFASAQRFRPIDEFLYRLRVEVAALDALESGRAHRPAVGVLSPTGSRHESLLDRAEFREPLRAFAQANAANGVYDVVRALAFVDPPEEYARWLRAWVEEADEPTKWNRLSWLAGLTRTLPGQQRTAHADALVEPLFELFRDGWQADDASRERNYAYGEAAKTLALLRHTGTLAVLVQQVELRTALDDAWADYRIAWDPDADHRVRRAAKRPLHTLGLWEPPKVREARIRSSREPPPVDGPEISGWVVDERGEPLEGASVWAMDLRSKDPSHQPRLAVSDDEGAFTIRGLASGPRYCVGAYFEAWDGKATTGSPIQEHVTAHRRRLRLSVPTGRLSGVVLGPGRKPSDAVKETRLVHGDSGRQVTVQGPTFDLRLLPGGEWTVHALVRGDDEGGAGRDTWVEVGKARPAPGHWEFRDYGLDLDND